ncbi:CoA ester lyase [Pseudoroseicyclus sp. CXY001]|uniref:HpcH/HpaI aldolase/citrate lyase family protein n=1 Tax=Pseudoroseicyclus sp. CXY001 TaxID=3242492 RepID=UPI00358DABE8
MTLRPWRSALYIPASKPRAMDKARGLDADALIFDLEDAVTPAEKPAAREALAVALKAGGHGPRACLVRINGLSTPWGEEDLAALAALRPDGVLLPKVGAAEDLSAVAARLPGLPLWAMIETPRGVLAAAEIAAHPGLEGLVLGTNDLAAELGARSRAGLAHALQHTLLAGRAAGRIVLDGVYNAFRDEAGLRAEAEEALAWGFDGKSLIHPGQIAPVNEVFTPSPEAQAAARALIAAHRQAEAAGQGVAVHEGRIVESLHVAAAEALLARATLAGPR